MIDITTSVSSSVVVHLTDPHRPQTHHPLQVSGASAPLRLLAGRLAPAGWKDFSLGGSCSPAFVFSCEDMNPDRVHSTGIFVGMGPSALVNAAGLV